MNDIQFKELLELYINNRLNKLLENNNCTVYTKDDYVIQDNKYNIPTNTENIIFNVESIDFENNIVSITNINNLQYPLNNKKIFVNYNFGLDITMLSDNKFQFDNKDDIYLIAVGDIITEKVDTKDNKIYIIVDVDDVKVTTETMTTTHNNTYYTVSILIGSNDFKNNSDKYSFFFSEVVRIFNEQSFNIKYKDKDLDIFTVTKPRYKSSVNTENDRIGWIILTFSHFYNNKIII